MPRDRILYIHGRADDPSEPLILGHGWERRPEERLNSSPAGPDDDWRIRDGIDHIEGYFAETFKPTGELICRLSAFFDSIANVCDIRTMGHALADVDEPYISAVMDRVDLASTRWTVSVHKDLEERRARFGAFAIAAHLVRYLEMPDFD